ncbi:MAG: hypothetical protein M1377_07730 [Deltaproteobacteria bacterium]|nr:hypothetical protein [Deltaproteobacteria bacterium]
MGRPDCRGFCFIVPAVVIVAALAWAGGLLDGVTVASLGLMAAVTWQLGRASFVDLPTIAIGLVSAVLLFRFKVNSTWLVAGGAAIGLLGMLLR